MVVVDSVTKRSHFVSTVSTLSAAGTAQLYLRHIWKHHGLPRRVVSDRGPQFVAEFMKELYRTLGVKLAATTAYHPQGDGQTERINQELEQFLRLFINQRQDDWDDLLPLVEFQYNNHVHSATQNVPFLLDTGRIPCMGFEPDLLRSVSHVNSVSISVRIATLPQAYSCFTISSRVRPLRKFGKFPCHSGSSVTILNTIT